MARSSRPARTPAKVSDSINAHLNLYALAAGAAGVGMLALAPPVHAKIAYTPADVNFSRYLPVPLDLKPRWDRRFRFGFRRARRQC
jgi:hypothetical protein